MELSERSNHVTTVKLRHDLVSMEYFRPQGRETHIAEYFCEARTAHSVETEPDRFRPGRAAIIGPSNLGRSGHRGGYVLMESAVESLG